MKILGCSDALLHTQLEHLIAGQSLFKDTPQVSLSSFLSLPIPAGDDPREPLPIAVISAGTGRKLAQIIKSV